VKASDHTEIRFIIELGEEYTLKMLVIIQFDNYVPVSCPKGK
jgi:hypothetical protein